MTEHKPLSDDELAEIREFLKGRRAVAWLFRNAKGIAAWLAIVVGAWMTATGALAKWLRGLLGDGQ